MEERYQRCRDCERVAPLGTMMERDNGCACGSDRSVLQRDGELVTRICCVCGVERLAGIHRLCGRPVLVEGKVQFRDGCGSQNVVELHLVTKGNKLPN